MIQYEFLNPEALLLFIPLIFGLMILKKFGIKKRARLITPSDHWFDKRPNKRQITPFKIHFILRTLALILLILATARPQQLSINEKRNIDIVDIMIAFDLSKSMDAIDFTPDRRTVALKTIDNFIDQRKSDRIGLTLFSGDAFLSVPLTTDHKFLKRNLNQSNSNHIQDGTAIGQALAVSVNHLKESKSKSRIIILLTDGDNNRGTISPRTAAALAQGYGLKVYTIGIGKKGRVAFPIIQRDAFGNKRKIMNYLTNALDEKLLQEIATKTGGQFFRAQDPNVLKKVFETIDKLEKTRIEVKKFTKRAELVWPLLFLAFALLILEAIALNTKWRKFP